MKALSVKTRHVETECEKEDSVSVTDEVQHAAERLRGNEIHTDIELN